LLSRVTPPSYLFTLPYTTLFRSGVRRTTTPTPLLWETAPRPRNTPTEEGSAEESLLEEDLPEEDSAAATSAAERSTEEHLAEERSEEHTSELQSRFDLVCRLLLE